MTPRRRSSPVRRISRRTLLTDFGAGGIGIIVLGACAGSDDSAGTTDAAATEPNSSGLQLQHVSLGFVSAYVLVRGSDAAVVDTGSSGSRDAIVAGLDALSVGPSAVRHIVLTHNHGDHIGGLSGLESDFSAATVHIGAADAATVQTSLTLAEVNDGDEIFGMGVIETPGHTAGSISLFDTESGILVAGDAVNGDEQGGLTGPNEQFSADMTTAGASVARLAALMPTTVAFGHGGAPVTEDAAAKLAALA